MIPPDSTWPTAGENSEWTRSRIDGWNGTEGRSSHGRRSGMGCVRVGRSGGCPASGTSRPSQITYTVRYVRSKGLGWRGAVFTRLKPVFRQGAATVYTVSQDATTRLLEQVTQEPGSLHPANPESHGVQRLPRRRSIGLQPQARDPGCLEGRGIRPLKPATEDMPRQAGTRR